MGSDIFEFIKKSYFHRKILHINLNNVDVISSASVVMAKEIKEITRNIKAIITTFGIDLNQFKKCFLKIMKILLLE